MIEGFRRLALAAVAGCLIAVFQGAAHAQDGHADTEAQVSREYLIKAALLYNFAKFATWPAEAFRDARAPLRVCILGADPFGVALESIDGKRIRNRRLVTARIDEVGGAERCHVLFVSASERDRLTSILESIREQPILTVADMPWFARFGGIIALKVVQDRSRFEINIDAANDVGLSLSSRLLRLADIVRRQTAQRAPEPHVQ